MSALLAVFSPAHTVLRSWLGNILEGCFSFITLCWGWWIASLFLCFPLMVSLWHTLLWFIIFAGFIVGEWLRLDAYKHPVFSFFFLSPWSIKSLIIHIPPCTLITVFNFLIVCLQASRDFISASMVWAKNRNWRWCFSTRVAHPGFSNDWWWCFHAQQS